MTDEDRAAYLAKARAAARRGESANLTAAEEADLFERAGFAAVGGREFVGNFAGKRVRLS